MCPTTTIDCQISVIRHGGRLLVCCDIEHFIPSGLTVPELFAELRLQLVEAIEDAAVRCPLDDRPARAPRVQMDVDVVDPRIALLVHEPAACLPDADACIQRLEKIVTRFVAEHHFRSTT